MGGAFEIAQVVGGFLDRPLGIVARCDSDMFWIIRAGEELFGVLASDAPCWFLDDRAIDGDAGIVRHLDALLHSAADAVDVVGESIEPSREPLDRFDEFIDIATCLAMLLPESLAGFARPDGF